MSWMDSWSRPGKSQATPAPYYLLSGGENTLYCRSCGRVVSSRKANNAGTAPAAAAARGDSKKKKKKKGHQTITPAKYCSARCRNHKPGRLDREIEAVFVRMLGGEEEKEETKVKVEGDGIAGPGTEPLDSGERKKRSTDTHNKIPKRERHKTFSKGDHRILVSCDEVERHIFGDHHGDPDKTFGRKKNRASRAAVLQAATTSSPVSSKPREVPPDAITAAAAAATEDDSDSGIAISDDDDYYNDVEDVEFNNSEEVEVPVAPVAAAGTVVDGDVLARLSVRSGTRVRPPQNVSEVNGSVGGERGRAERGIETREMARRRLEGRRRALRREMVRCAARRLVAFGIADGDGDGDNDGYGGGGGGGGGKKKKCEAVMLGKVVEPSFAKGSWGVRWRE